ncbi:Galactose-specific lectin nattectin [Symbiodinium microadriaticum]|uniref:Galactose-specific lectin nattectin n=1 Tax=Symbiodinium microadriaticum TaxID=2951 RepID=A0A1Q9DAI3_SYMMI|nr:Galactose-specific lectin nattectin [Symbiodinium microadriaticum]
MRPLLGHHAELQSLFAWSMLLAAAATCPNQWHVFQGRCYRAFEGAADWDQAKAACESYGATLASIHSEAENDHCIFACGNVRPFHQGCWIGGTDRHPRKRNVWVWVDGSPFQWSKWFDHGGGNVEPNNDFCTDHRHCRYGHTADCNVLEVSKPFKGYWLDTFCTDRQKFICKVDDSDAARKAASAATEDWEDVPRKVNAPLPSPPRPAVPDAPSPKQATPPLPAPPPPVPVPPPRPPPPIQEASLEAPEAPAPTETAPIGPVPSSASAPGRVEPPAIEPAEQVKPAGDSADPEGEPEEDYPDDIYQ